MAEPMLMHNLPLSIGSHVHEHVCLITVLTVSTFSDYFAALCWRLEGHINLCLNDRRHSHSFTSHCRLRPAAVMLAKISLLRRRRCQTWVLSVPVSESVRCLSQTAIARARTETREVHSFWMMCVCCFFLVSKFLNYRRSPKGLVTVFYNPLCTIGVVCRPSPTPKKP